MQAMGGFSDVGSSDISVIWLIVKETRMRILWNNNMDGDDGDHPSGKDV